MNREPFSTDSIYHIYNRGVDKRGIFNNESDKIRFIRNLFEFNDENPALNQYYKDRVYEVQPRKQIVEILVYCLMPNHYHLLLRQVSENGISTFMKKLGTGYTMYFNLKYVRDGSLFQGKFKSVLIENDIHLRYIPHYIHLNPLDLSMPTWRDRRINHKKAIDDLRRYKWSSIYDYLGQPKFTDIVNTNFISELYTSSYSKELKDYLSNFDILQLDNVTLE